MLNLQWRLQSLDPDASESLRVISFFDSLDESHAGIEPLLRATALLVSAEVGMHDLVSSKAIISDASGKAHKATTLPGGGYLSRNIGTDREREVFIRREDERWHQNDELVLERLAMSLRRAFERSDAVQVRSPLDVLLDPAAGSADKIEAATRLRLSPSDPVRAIASSFSEQSRPSSRSGIVFTHAGILKAEIADAEGFTVPQRAGVGRAVTPLEFHQSWQSAEVALRASTTAHQVVYADELGILVELLSGDLPDNLSFNAALASHDWALETVAALIRTSGVRDASRELSLHHSTTQWRIKALSEDLGYDPLKGLGSHRLALEFFVYCMHTNRF